MNRQSDRKDQTSGNSFEKKNMTAEERNSMPDEKQIVRRLSSVGIAGNILLVIFKLFAGIYGHSGAMISDGIHSLSDVFATFIAWLGVRLGRKAADAQHPYGHERMECVAGMVLGAVLFATGVGIGWNGMKQIFSGEAAAPSLIALIAAVVSIVSKEAMFHYTRYWAKKIHSSAFMADAWHHRSDALSSIGSLAGIGGAMLGVSILEPISATVIAVFILKVSYDIIRDALDKMLDSSCGEAYENELKGFIREQSGVRRLDVLHTRKFGDKIYIDAEIAVDGSMSLRDAHEIAETVHNAVEQKYPEIKHIMIHENPV